MTFGATGNIVLTPMDVGSLTRDKIARFINDSLLPGTPAVFTSYSDYRDFVEFLSVRLNVHPANLIFRGSAKIGFSIRPHSSKLWCGLSTSSDIDLAIVDPDLYQMLDTEVRQWERQNPSPGKVNPFKVSNLRQCRSRLCYNHRDLPDTLFVDRYKKVMDEATENFPNGIRDVTAFFYRDYWSLRSRYEYDLCEVLEGLQKNLPQPIQIIRSRESLNDRDLGCAAKIVGRTELCLSRASNDDESISDLALQGLKAATDLHTLWLDDTLITDVGCSFLKDLLKLEVLSVQRTKLTNASMQHIAKIPKLKKLFLDADSRIHPAFRSPKITDAGMSELREAKGLTELSLSNTSVTSTGLGLLQNLQLQRLWIDGTRAAKDVSEVKKFFPKTTVFTCRLC